MMVVYKLLKSISFISIILLLFLLTVLTGCNTTDKTDSKLKIEYTVLVESDSQRIDKSRKMLATLVTNLLSGYQAGITFDYMSEKSIKTLIDTEISLKEKKATVSVVRRNTTNWLIEKGLFICNKPVIKNYSRSKTIRIVMKGDTFGILYNRAVVSAVRKGCVPGESGVVVPQGQLTIRLDNRGIIHLKEHFTVYTK